MIASACWRRDKLYRARVWATRVGAPNGGDAQRSPRWLRHLRTNTAQPLPGTEGATYPFWSPDSRRIGFFADGKLKKIDIAGGPPIAIADAAGA